MTFEFVLVVTRISSGSFGDVSGITLNIAGKLFSSQSYYASQCEVCKELGRSITPYLARELFFDEESDYYAPKLNFICDSENCGVELVGVNIYSEKKPKKALHHRTKPNLVHSPECEFILEQHRQGITEVGQKQKEEGFKVTKYPSVFLLDRPKPTLNGSGNKEIEQYGEKIENATKRAMYIKRVSQ